MTPIEPEETCPVYAEPITTALVAFERSSVSPEVAVDELVPMLYQELRRMARRQLAAEGDQLTLDTTGLVHESYLKLVDQKRTTPNSRRYFFGAASRAMRQVLVDAARRRRRVKRGSGQRPVQLGSMLDEPAGEIDGLAADILDLEGALSRLERELPRPARVVECRFFAGLSVEETAAALEVSARTVKSDWALARAWLFRALEETS